MRDHRARPPEDDATLYLMQIGGRPLLTAADEQRLARKIEQGRQARARFEGQGILSPETRRALEAAAAEGERAVQTFVESNLRLVVSIARRYLNAGVPLLDLVQEGNIGLLRAVERFDHRREVRFSTFATWLIRQAIVRGVANTGRLVRLPVRAGETVARVRNMAHQLEGTLGRTPTTAEVAAAVGLPVDRTEDAMRHAQVPLSLSLAVGEDGETELGELIEDRAHAAADGLAASLLHHEVRQFLRVLNDRQRAVVSLRYGLDGTDPQPFSAVARQLQLGVEATRSIHREALRKLRATVGGRDDVRELLAG